MSVFDDYLPWTHERARALGKDELNRLLLVRSDISQDQLIPITNLMVLLYTKQHGFIDLDLYKNRCLLVEWYTKKGRSIYNLDSFETLAQRAEYACEKKKKGVNLVGYSKGQLGLGEDLRAFSVLLSQLDIDYAIYPIGHPSDNPDELSGHSESVELTFSHSLFFMNVIELGKLIKCYSDFRSVFGYTIAVPPWELPVAPPDWKSTLMQFDEVWGMSEFVCDALRPICSNIKYSAPVVLPAAEIKIDRFKRQARPFTFLYVFDSASFISRKNPESVVMAFLKAFPNPNTSVRLILKTTPFSSSHKLTELLKLVGSDSRISILTQRISSAELNHLWQQCDCYISLHRSEGFGRTIADAVSRMIPVIATNWSGNIDITGENYELGVAYKLVEVEKEEYPYADQQLWAEPDFCCAAAKMNWVYQNQSSAALAEIVRRSHQRYLEKFSVHATRPAIEELFNKRS